jgi:cytochrome c553
MNKLLTTIFAMAVASVTAAAGAQSAPASAPAPAAAAAPAPASKGNAKAAEAKIAMCIGCHGIVGYQASFPQVHKVPMISGQSAGYIASALNAYKTGDRRHPTMRGIADSLSEQDINDIAAYYEASGKSEPVAAEPSKAPSAKVQALLNKAACVSCHGANFSKPVDANTPKIGGQHADYLFVALKQYKSGNDKIGRANPIMAGFAKQYTEAELKDLAGYIGSLKGELKTVPERRFR